MTAEEHRRFTIMFAQSEQAVNEARRQQQIAKVPEASNHFQQVHIGGTKRATPPGTEERLESPKKSKNDSIEHSLPHPSEGGHQSPLRDRVEDMQTQSQEQEDDDEDLEDIDYDEVDFSAMLRNEEDDEGDMDKENSI
jgi:hypothetical protein